MQSRLQKIQTSLTGRHGPSGLDRVRTARLASLGQLTEQARQQDRSVHVTLESGGIQYEVISTMFDDELSDKRVWKAGLTRSTRENDESIGGDILLYEGTRGWTGTIRTQEGIFHLVPIGDGLHAVVQQSWGELPKEAPPVGDVYETPPPCDPFDPDPPQYCDPPPPPPPCDDCDPPPPPSNHVVDVLVAYTPTAESLAETYSANLEDYINLLEIQTNESFIRSKINNLEINIDTTLQVPNTTTSSIKYIQNRISNPSDGVWDGVHSARQTAGSDIVVLLIGDETSYCGIAERIQVQSPSEAFATAQANCAMPIYTFAHEIGHLFGARHDLDADPTLTPYAYGHGRTKRRPWYDPGFADEWRTIMAYGGDLVRLRNWSNPSVRYDPDYPNDPNEGYPTGDYDRENNHRVIENRAAFMAGLLTPSGSNLLASKGASSTIGSSSTEGFGFSGAAPNPFRSSTTFRFALNASAHVRIAAYDLLGREVAVLANNFHDAGTHSATLRAESLPAGTYIVQMQTGEHIETTRVTLAR